MGSAMSECAFVHENAAAHVVLALEPEESVRVHRHIALCPHCASIVHDIEEAVSLLPYAVPLAEPPARVKQSLLSETARLSSTDGEFADPMFPVGPGGRTLTLPASSEGWLGRRRVARRPNRRRFHPNWEYLVAPLAAVPLVLALAIVGGWAFQTQSELSDRSDEVSELRVANETLAHQLASVTEGMPDIGAQKIALDPVGADFAGSASYLLANPDQNAVTVVLRKATGADAFTVICESKDGQLLELGEVAVNEDGNGANSWQLPMPAGRLRSVHIQPAGESDGATADGLLIEDVLRVEMADDLGADDGTAARASSR
jgi:hypothetical protein